jgi:hypothetical protein
LSVFQAIRYLKTKLKIVTKTEPGLCAVPVRGGIAGQVDALRLALDHARDLTGRLEEGTDSAS